MSTLAWGNAPGFVNPNPTALKARFSSHSVFSIPDVPLVEIDAMLAQQLEIFFLKCASAMVLLLVVYVIQHTLELTWAHRKCAVTTLRRKGSIPRINSLDPF